MNWDEALQRASEAVNEYDGAIWPSFAFRVLVDDAKPRLRLIAANIQGVFDERLPEVKTVIVQPTVLHGVLTRDELLSLLQAWTNSRPFTLGPVEFDPPNMLSAYWTPNAIDREVQPFLEPLPARGSAYRVRRLHGYGAEDHDVASAIYQAANASSPYIDTWVREYLGFASYQPGMVLVSLQLPMPVALNATYDRTTRNVTVTIFYHRPYTVADFWVRVGPRWTIAESRAHFQKEVALGDGWWQASFARTLQADEGPVRVWAGWEHEPNQFQWQNAVALGGAVTPESQRRDFLTLFYGLSKRALADHIGTAAAPPQGGKSQSVNAPALELAIANACTALGYATMFGGTVLQTPGIDLIAFDAEGKVAYAVSVTVSNDIPQKIRTLRLVLPDLEQALAPSWLVKPVVLTSLPSEKVNKADVQLAIDEQMLLLTLDDLGGLLEAPPNLDDLDGGLRRPIPPRGAKPVWPA